MRSVTEVVLVELNEKPKRTNNIYLSDLKKPQLLAFLVKALKTPERYALAWAEAYIDPFREEAKDLVTLTEYLEERGIKVDRSQKHRLANIINDMYLVEYGTPPRSTYRPNSSGKWLSKASGFKRSQLYLLDRAIEETLDSSDTEQY